MSEKTSKKAIKKGSRVKLHHTDGEQLHAVVDHVQKDGLIEVTIDHKGHEKHGQKSVVRADGIVGGGKAKATKSAKKGPAKKKARKSRKAKDSDETEVEAAGASESAQDEETEESTD